MDCCLFTIVLFIILTRGVIDWRRWHTYFLFVDPPDAAELS